METAMLRPIAIDRRIGADLRLGELPVETGSGPGWSRNRGAHAKAVKINAKGGKYSTKRRA
jgi:hypothetical protein